MAELSKIFGRSVFVLTVLTKESKVLSKEGIDLYLNPAG